VTRSIGILLWRRLNQWQTGLGLDFSQAKAAREISRLRLFQKFLASLTNLTDEANPMPELVQPRPQEITQEIQKIRESYDAFKAKGLKLNLTRGKPSTAQLDLSAELLSSRYGGLRCRRRQRLP